MGLKDWDFIEKLKLTKVFWISLVVMIILFFLPEFLTSSRTWADGFASAGFPFIYKTYGGYPYSSSFSLVPLILDIIIIIAIPFIINNIVLNIKNPHKDEYSGNFQFILSSIGAILGILSIFCLLVLTRLTDFDMVEKIVVGIFVVIPSLFFVFLVIIQFGGLSDRISGTNWRFIQSKWISLIILLILIGVFYMGNFLGILFFSFDKIGAENCGIYNIDRVDADVGYNNDILACLNQNYQNCEHTLMESTSRNRWADIPYSIIMKKKESYCEISLYDLGKEVDTCKSMKTTEEVFGTMLNLSNCEKLDFITLNPNDLMTHSKSQRS